MEATAVKLISEGYYEGFKDGIQHVSIEMEIDPSTGATIAAASGTGTDASSGTSSNTGSAHGSGLTPKDVMIQVDKDDQATRIHGDMTLVEWWVTNPKKR